jgi:hypothetical protein
MAGLVFGPGLALGNVTRLNQCIDASLGQLGTIFSKAVIQKWATDPIFAAVVVIVPSAVL